MKEVFDRLNEAIINTSVSIDDFAQSLKNINNVFVCDSGKWESKVEVKTLRPAICSCCGGRIGRENYCEYCGMRYW